MVSRIILTTADFSANNIGRIVELSDFTKKVLAKQTQYSEESTEAAALNDFFNALIADGFIGGDTPLLQFLAIPALAANHDELLYNVAALDENGYPVNSMPQDEIDANVKAFYTYEVDGRNVALARYAVEGQSDVPPLDQYSVNVGWLASDYSKWPSKSIIFYSLAISAVATHNFIVNRSSNAHPVVNPDEIVLLYGQTKKVATPVTHANSSKPYLGFNGINYVANTRFEGVFDNVTLGETTLDSDLENGMGTGSVEAKYNAFQIGQYRYGWTTALPLLAFGDYIPLAKMSNLRQYVNTLLSALHVIQ